MVVAGLALLWSALMVTIFLGTRYLVEMDRQNNDVPVVNLTLLLDRFQQTTLPQRCYNFYLSFSAYFTSFVNFINMVVAELLVLTGMLVIGTYWATMYHLQPEQEKTSGPLTLSTSVPEARLHLYDLIFNNK